MSSIQDGATYRLTNVKSRTCMELDADKREVGASHPNDWDNQKWVFEKIGNDFFIKSVKNNEYLAPSALGDGNQLIVMDTPQRWFVNDESPAERTIRIFIVKFAVDLKDGSSVAGTPVQLWTDTPGNQNQIWEITEV